MKFAINNPSFLFFFITKELAVSFVKRDFSTSIYLIGSSLTSLQLQYTTLVKNGQIISIRNQKVLIINFI